MGMLPFATRSIAELVIWSGLAMFILARANGIDTMTLVQLNNEKAHNYLQIILDSPECFAYEERQIYEKIGEDGKIMNVNEEIITRTGVIDITKFLDYRHQNCLRKSELWSSKAGVDLLVDNDGDGEADIKTCGWSSHSNFFFGLLGDWDKNDDCPDGYECVNNGCVDKSCFDPNSIVPCMEENQGNFLVYNLTLFDAVTEQEYKIISYEQGVKLVYKPSTGYDEYSGEDWADYYYPEYLTCNTDFGGEIVDAASPIIIAYPSNEGIETHIGILAIDLCLGTYGNPLR